MATYKRIDGDYNITTVNSDDNVVITTHTVKVYGNLDVNGNQNIYGNLTVAGNITYIDVTDLIVADPFITVAANNTGNVSNALFQSQGLVAQTSSNTYAGIRFNNGDLSWQISNNVLANGAPITSYANILTTTTMPTPGGPENSIQINVGNTFYGDIDFQYDYANGQLLLDGYFIMYDIPTPPVGAANSVSMYHQPVGAGGTGLYVTTNTIDDEVCSRKKAIVFGLVL